MLDHARELWNRYSAHAIPVGIFAFVLAVYTRTLAPGVIGGDAGELQFVPYILGLAHSTGYPLYCLLGKLWITLLPLGSVAWKMNLLSAVFGALTAVVIYAAVRDLSGFHLPGAVAGLTVAFTPAFWEQAIIADKYASVAFEWVTPIWLALRWRAKRPRYGLHLLALSLGLGMAHHRTIILLLPWVIGYVAWHERSGLWRNRRRLAILAGLMLAPLLFYLYLPWAESRNLPPGSWHPQGIVGWMEYMADLGYVRQVYIGPDLVERANHYLAQVEPVGIILLIAGLVGMALRHRADAIMLGGAYLSYTLPALNYHIPDYWIFFAASIAMAGIAWGEALVLAIRYIVHGEAIRVAGKAATLYRWKLLGPLVLIGMMWLPLKPLADTYPRLREATFGLPALDPWRQELQLGGGAMRIGEALSLVEPDAIIVGDWEQVTPLWYYQQVEGYAPDVTIMYPIERLSEAAETGRPLYVTRILPGVAESFHPFSVGPLVALRSEPTFEMPPDVTRLGLNLGDMIELAGYSLPDANNAVKAGGVLQLTLYWRALIDLDEDYSVSLRLLDSNGSEVWREDQEHPALGMYPTSHWQAGEIVGDYREIPFPRTTPPGTYRWAVVAYRPLGDGQWENLEYTSPQGQTSLVIGADVVVIP